MKKMIFLCVLISTFCATKQELWMGKNGKRYKKLETTCKSYDIAWQYIFQGNSCKRYNPKLRLQLEQAKIKSKLEKQKEAVCEAVEKKEYEEVKDEKIEKPTHGMSCICRKKKCSLFEKDLELGVFFLGMLAPAMKNDVIYKDIQKIQSIKNLSEKPKAFRIVRKYCPVFTMMYKDEVSKYKKRLAKYKKDKLAQKKKKENCKLAEIKLSNFNDKVNSKHNKEIENFRSLCKKAEPYCTEYRKMDSEYKNVVSY